MSEDDRAAKATRGKAMFKKRQQKKAAGDVAPGSGVLSPLASPPVSRPFTPVNTDGGAFQDEKGAFGDVFFKNDSDTSWVNSLPRVASPPPSVRALSPPVPSKSPPASLKSPPTLSKSPPPHVASMTQSSVVPSPAVDEKDVLVRYQQKQIATLQSEKALASKVERLPQIESHANELSSLLAKEKSETKQLQDRVHQLLAEHERLAQNQQQTITLLVSEKASMTAELERLENVETKAQEKESLLVQETAKTQELAYRVQQLEADVTATAQYIQESQSKERILADRYRDQERQLQLTNATLNDLRSAAEQHQRRVRELEEQIQSDDRVEQLESSLKNTQDRADSLEFQLSKVKQAHLSLKTEQENLEGKLRDHHNNEAEWESKHSELQARHATTQQQLDVLVAENNKLHGEKETLESQLLSTQKSLGELQEKLVQAASEQVNVSRLLQAAQNEAKNATRRADEAERIQKDLQLEGTNLMRSLDEMRPKIVELTSAKLELTEKVDNLEHSLRSRDAVIARLEGEVDELRHNKDEAEQQWQKDLASREKEYSSAQDSAAELQKAYTALQAEHDAAQDSIFSFENERSKHVQEAARWVAEADQLKAASRKQADEIVRLQQELEELQRVQEEEQDFLDRARNEIEALRADVAAKDDELQRLQRLAAAPADTAPRSLDDEMLSSLRQQHALDLSAAQSQIRALESAVFDADARAHALQRQVQLLEEQRLPSRAASRAGARALSPGSRPASRAQTDLRRASFSARAQAPARSVFDQNLSPETRHKRRVSLSMLKARIESEAAAHAHPASRTGTPVPPPRLPAIVEPTRGHALQRPQFLDESHVFWCSSCSGDLVIL